MNYEETYETAYAIGYHTAKYPDCADVDREAFRSMLVRVPDRFRIMAWRRFDEGRKVS